MLRYHPPRRAYYSSQLDLPGQAGEWARGGSSYDGYWRTQYGNQPQCTPTPIYLVIGPEGDDEQGVHHWALRGRGAELPGGHGGWGGGKQIRMQGFERIPLGDSKEQRGDLVRAQQNRGTILGRVPPARQGAAQAPSPAVNFCPACGVRALRGANFCVTCGARLPALGAGGLVHDDAAGGPRGNAHLARAEGGEDARAPLPSPPPYPYRDAQPLQAPLSPLGGIPHVPSAPPHAWPLKAEQANPPAPPPQDHPAQNQVHAHAQAQQPFQASTPKPQGPQDGPVHPPERHLDELPPAAPAQERQPPVDSKGPGERGEDGEFGFEEAVEGEQWLAVRPYQGKVKSFAATGYDACTPPTKEAVGAPPDAQIVLAHVHGYNKGPLAYSASGAAVFGAAGVCVCQAAGGGRQVIFKGHGDDVSCLALDSEGRYAVSGEMGKASVVCVWDTSDGVEQVRLSGFHRQGVVAVAFGHGGDRVVTVGKDDDHSVCVWDWRTNTRVAHEKGDKNLILAVACSPFDGENDGMGTIVTVGVKHVRFWTIEGGALKGKKGSLGKLSEPQPVVCVDFIRSTTADEAACPQGYTLTGFHDGSVGVWKAAALFKVVKAAHRGPVQAIFSSRLPDSGVVATGGRDGKVKVWTANTFGSTKDTIREMDVAEACKGCAGVAALGKVSVKGLGARLGADGLLQFAVGTSGSEVYELSLDAIHTTREATGVALASGHASGELWGACSIPKEDQGFVTLGDDGTLRVWDGSKHAARVCALVKGREEGTGAGRAVSAWGGREQLVCACGLMDGEILVMKVEVSHAEQVQRISDRKKEISEVKFSPCGTFLAAGSKEKAIDVYAKGEDGKFGRIAVLKGHASGVTHIDWSEDSEWMQSTDSGYDLLFWRAPKEAAKGGKPADVKPHTKAGDLAGVKWSSFTCSLGWPVIGVFGAGADGSDVNAVDRSSDRSVLLSADDFGKVNVFNYPAVEGAKSDAQGGHSAHVTNVRMSSDGSKAISTGGRDLCVFFWEIKKKDT